MGFEAQLVPTPRGLRPNLCLHPLRDLLDPTEPLEAPLAAPLEAAQPLLKLGHPVASLEPLIPPLVPGQMAPLERELPDLDPLNERLGIGPLEPAKVAPLGVH